MSAFTFKTYLLSEAEGKDPKEVMQDKQQQENKTINLVGEIRKVMQSIDLSEPLTAIKDPRSFTFIDLVEALETVREVILNKLSSQSIKTARDTQEVTPATERYKGDADKKYKSFFQSVESEAKDAVRSVFALPGGKGELGSLPRFVGVFNNLIVSRIIEAIKELPPEQWENGLNGVIKSGKDAVINNQIQRGDISTAEARQMLNQYRRARKATIATKDTGSRSKADRVKLINNIAQRFENTK